MNPNAPKKKPAPSAILIIKEAAAREFGVTVDAIDAGVRRRPVPTARHVGVTVARSVLFASFQEIARAFCLKDHMGAVYATHRVAARRADPDFAARVSRVEAAAVAALPRRAAA